MNRNLSGEKPNLCRVRAQLSPRSSVFWHYEWSEVPGGKFLITALGVGNTTFEIPWLPEVLREQADGNPEPIELKDKLGTAHQLSSQGKRNLALARALELVTRILVGSTRYSGTRTHHCGKPDMATGFIDLDILLTKVRNVQSKMYFFDAAKAYKAGALRGAMTSAWVALVFDLIAKYRELSAMGDAAATSFVTSWDAATAANDVKRLVQLEGSILEDAAINTQVINRITLTHLERLREDRHLCAHPAFSAEAELFEPTPELVRLHLVNTVDLVLSQEPLQGKAIFNFFADCSA